MSKKIDYSNMIGRHFEDWEVIEQNGTKSICKCSCGVIKEVSSYDLISGRSKSCGHNKNKFDSLENKQFGEWTVVKYLGEHYYLCKCSCGKMKSIKRENLVRGKTMSCGCKRREKSKKTLLDRYGDTVTSRISNTREDWQIEVIKNKENLKEYLEQLNRKPTFKELGKLLGLSRHRISVYIHKYELEEYITINPLYSEEEKEVLNFIKEISNCNTIENSKTIISPYEIDMYIPDKKMGIEFNGNYWHSDIKVDKGYHKSKVLIAKEKGIRLIHIYEYEWKNNKEKIKQYLRNILLDSSEKKKIYARNTELRLVSSDEAYKFEEANHLQGKALSTFNIGLYSKEDKSRLIGLMTFGKPRFNSESEWEIIRLCYEPSTMIIGGAEKMFKLFLKEVNPESVITYATLDKFYGTIYNKLGFKFNGYTEPGYVWVDSNNCVLSRYQTQKKSLVARGWGTDNQTEDEIMKNLGFYKVYNSGNIKYLWKK